MVRDLFQLVQRLLAKPVVEATTGKRAAGKPRAPEVPESQISEYQKELAQIRRDFAHMGRAHQQSGTLHTADGRPVPVKRVGQAFLL